MFGQVISLICAIITFGMALLQLSITLGAPFGEYVFGGRHRVLPPKMRFTSVTFFILFVIIGVAYLQSGEIWDIGWNAGFVSVIVIVNTLFLAYAIVGNGFLTKSKKEKHVMTPLSIIQFVFSVCAYFLTLNT